METSKELPSAEPFDSMSPSRAMARSVFGGTLMGLANLVPGISGGTMLLVAGIYPQFIESVAKLTRFRLNRFSMIVLSCIAVSAGISILLFAGLLKDLVLDHRWVMYSLFIGLTLGGLPLVWRMAQPVTTPLILAAVTSFAGMVALAILQFYGIVGSTGENGFAYFAAGALAAMAMVLPGISGGYLLLLMGKYIPILAAIEQFKTALASRDVSAGVEALKTLLPVAAGVMLGILVTGNLLKWMLERHPKITLGVLLGLLLGSVAGLYPFQEGLPPAIGDTLKGISVTAENIQQFDKKDWSVQFRYPTFLEALIALAVIATGFAITRFIAALGNDSAQESQPIG